MTVGFVTPYYAQAEVAGKWLTHSRRIGIGDNLRPGATRPFAPTRPPDGRDLAVRSETFRQYSQGPCTRRSRGLPSYSRFSESSPSFRDYRESMISRSMRATG